MQEYGDVIESRDAFMITSHWPSPPAYISQQQGGVSLNSLKEIKIREHPISDRADAG